MTRPSPPAAPLTGRLPASTPGQALLSRLAFDARFSRWLSETLRHPSVSVSRRASGGRWRLSCDSDHGRFSLAVDIADWPALQLAVAMDDAADACAVLTVLLAPWAEALAPALGTVRVAAVAPIDGPSPEVAVVSFGDLRIGWHDADADLLDRLSLLCLRPGVTDIQPFAALPLRSRLRLLARSLPRAVLQSLRIGDVVLAGDQAPLLLCGVGRTLQARVHIHPKEFTVHVAESPYVAEDPGVPDAPAASASTLDELQLPVAFELDTARVSLADLANMAPGYAVELDVPLAEAAVRLICHGQTLGHGQLIAIGDRLGVRITRLEFVHDAAVAS
ncbi:type III secretion system cytoplasmic ring protein SctQ [Roseateles amylovorans]|uniref:Type III secretion system cytoplasmic ring protein SctQ n=1 Tax=Roseateles amylovorans TaxID=2978473 RepID=A0ABY6AZB1_9BURK|nr:type III secretion system cytoplasmic ring protein SctQ [Roseateles amylovorans]UXH78297.1 type III secretion system cytoplasmic ring protein SctQ [Roseateles amylovorans]